MQRATVGLIAFYKDNSALFDGLKVPTGIEKSDLVDRMLLEIGEMELLYTNPLVMADAIGFWSKSRVEIWQKLTDIMSYEYNPIWNVDGETWHDGKTTGKEEINVADSRDYTRTRTDNDVFAGKIDESSDTTNLISADNQSAWSNDTKTDYNGERAENNTDNRTENITDKEGATRKTNGDKSGTDDWHEKRQGNIGVTMTQQLLEAEKALWENFDIYGYIIEDFKQEFCVMIY